MASLKTKVYASFVFILSIIQFTELGEGQETKLPPCPVRHSDVSSDVPCELRNETVFTGNNAVWQTDIRMIDWQLMLVLRNPTNLEIRNGDETIAKGRKIEDAEHTKKFVNRWFIAIAPEVDKNLRHEVFLRYTLFVRNVDSNDEYRFKLLFRSDTFSFQTNETFWFPITNQESAVPDDDTTPTSPTDAATSTAAPPATPETGCEALSQQEFQKAMKLQSDMMAELMKDNLGTCTCTWNSTLHVIAIVSVGVIALLGLLDSRFMNKYVYSKIGPVFSHCIQALRASEEGERNSGMEMSPSAPCLPTLNQDKVFVFSREQLLNLIRHFSSTASEDQNLPITATIQDDREQMNT